MTGVLRFIPILVRINDAGFRRRLAIVAIREEHYGLTKSDDSRSKSPRPQKKSGIVRICGQLKSSRRSGMTSGTPTTPVPSAGSPPTASSDIDPKVLRVFLRSGKAEGMFARDGKAYVFTKADVAKLKKGYAAFVADHAKEKAAPETTEEPKAS